MTTSEHIHQVYFYLCQWLEPAHAEIATRQAVIESGWFSSDAFHSKNNPFGLCWKGEIQSFPSVENACEEYYKQIYRKYDPSEHEDYFQFLEKLPYAGDSLYIWKVKHINLKLEA